MKTKYAIRICLASPFFFLSGCFNQENSPSGPGDTTVFKTYLARVPPRDSAGIDTSKADACGSPLIGWNGGCHPKDHVPVDQWPENRLDTAARGGGPEVHTINGIAHANLEDRREGG